MNKQYLYYQKIFNDWDYLEDNWSRIDNTKIANISDFNTLGTVFFILSDNSIYSVGDNDFQHSKKERNNYYGSKKDVTNFDNLENKLSKPSKKPFKNKFWQQQEFMLV